MLRVTMDNVAQKRTIRPLYAQHQATPYGGFLDPAWDRSVDIYPGMVMTKLDGEKFSLLVNNTQRPYGLAAQFIAPKLGIDELRGQGGGGTNLYSVWLGGPDAVFEILAPAFDTSAAWTNATDGSIQFLRTTIGAHAQGPGKLTTAAAGATVSTNAAARLIQVVGSSKIIVSFEKYTYA